jgi:hypothetical protein
VRLLSIPSRPAQSIPEKGLRALSEASVFLSLFLRVDFSGKFLFSARLNMQTAGGRATLSPVNILLIKCFLQFTWSSSRRSKDLLRPPRLCIMYRPCIHQQFFLNAGHQFFYAAPSLSNVRQNTSSECAHVPD